MDIFPDAWLDVWMLASYLEAEQQGTLEAWLATFTTAEGIRSFMQNYPPKHLHSHTPSLDQPGEPSNNPLSRAVPRVVLCSLARG